ncbi:uncharacterized protein EDB93DRAFT_1334955 [Suillus bovinus]|uniref:uncharacterized protein n=1 Tax=Suillus bovinus TaxID=48563 RepID=UPI001B870DA5|nr:uncharacterized protein EDB93DRAFT_1334955 [Suillus bovinus]KAG2158058.1 hypothetical protein EDB93DRAFT_1334955 [Suillus bovinus]
MLFVNVISAIILAGSVTAIPFRILPSQSKRDVNPALVPSFGWQSGINPDGTGNCDGAVNGTNGKPILVPCQCPPNSTFFLANLDKNVAAGFVTTNPTVKVSFPTDNSTASQLARLNAAAVTLQNLEGPGVGCPISSTTFSAQRNAISAEASSNGNSSATPSVYMPASSTFISSSAAIPTTASATPARSGVPTSSSVTNTAVPTSITSNNNPVSPTNEQIATLAPPLGWQAGINSDGTGNCDGAVNGTNGKPILIPCQCPPDQTHYIANLTANIRAGHVILNPTVQLTFPTDNSTASQSARLNAAAVTIQNLNGAGKGCPIVSTTFSAQQKAINAKSTS